MRRVAGGSDDAVLLSHERFEPRPEAGLRTRREPVAIDRQCRPHVGVAELTGHGRDVAPGRDQQRRTRMPHVVDSDSSQSRPTQRWDEYSAAKVEVIHRAALGVRQHKFHLAFRALQFPNLQRRDLGGRQLDEALAACGLGLAQRPRVATELPLDQ